MYEEISDNLSSWNETNVDSTRLRWTLERYNWYVFKVYQLRPDLTIHEKDNTARKSWIVKSGRNWYTLKLYQLYLSSVLSES
jgi:hypothetical protein